MGNMVFNSVSPWYILLCIGAGCAYAALLYARQDHFPPVFSWILAGLRVIIISALCALLLDPLVNSIHMLVEKPLIIIAQDRSSSIAAASGKGLDQQVYQARMRQLVKDLGKQYEVIPYSFGSGVKAGLDFHYTDQATDFSQLFDELSKRYENINLGAVILASDGIYNRGADPLYALKNFQSPFYTIALGDTIPSKDLLITSVNSNSLVYEGDKFQLLVEVSAHQLKGRNCRLTIESEGHQVFNTVIPVNSSNFSKQVSVMLDAGKPGFRRYSITADPLSGETNLLNNKKTSLVEVIKGKLKILILGAAPHPDLAALKQALLAYRNDEVTISTGADPARRNIAGYDLVILDQLPGNGSDASFVDRVFKSKVPLWLVIGDQNDMTRLNSLQNDLHINAGMSAAAELLPVWSQAFSSFTASDALRSALKNFPPLNGPPDYQVLKQGSVMLTQENKLHGNVHPLLFINEQGSRKIAYLMGTGLWRWRLSDFQQNGNHHATDELFGKLVQYLTAAEDKRRFRITMQQHVFTDNDAISFNAFLFNKSFEAVNGPDIELEIKNRTGREYRFAFNRSSDAYNLKTQSLPPGDYTYHASVVLNTEKFEAGGVFIIRPLQLEELSTTANHSLLYQLADKTGGRMVLPAGISTLPGLITHNELIRPQSHEQRSVQELISYRWLGVLLLALLSAEWAIRKWNGRF